MTTPLANVLETCLYVGDLDIAEQFYHEVLGLEVYSRQPGRHLFFRCGLQMFLLFLPSATKDPSSTLPLHGTEGAGHMAFAIAEQEVEDWRSRLAQHGVSIEQTVNWPGGGISLYFRDPAGNSIELATRKVWGLPDVAESML